MKLLRVGICLLFAFSVLAYGAVEVWSQSVLEIGAAMLFLWWGIGLIRDPGRPVHWSALNWPLLGFLGFGLAQYLFHWSIYPYLTRVELLKLSALVLLFFLATQAFREGAALRALTWFLLFFGFVVALFAIGQHLTSNGKLYWVREVTAGTPFGPYVNRNHFAGLMELILPLGLAMLVLRGVRREQVPLVGLFTIVPLGALVLSASRGGITSFVFQMGLLALLIRRAPAGRIRWWGAGAVVLAAAALIAWLGVGSVIGRFAEIRAGEVTASRRMVMLKGTWHVFLAHPWTGTGLGTLIVAYPPYETLYDGKVVDHAHNDYVETLADLGIFGGICGLAFLAIFVGKSRSGLRAGQNEFSRALHAGAVVACAGLLVHSLVDFNLHIPSNALLFLLLTHVSTVPPLPPVNSHRPSRVRRPISMVDSATPHGS